MTELGTLFLTHSSRTWSIFSTHLNYLTFRFQNPERLKKLPPPEKLRPRPTQHDSALSIHRVFSPGGKDIETHCLGTIASVEKMQHVLRLNTKNLLVGFDHGLEQWRFAQPLEALDPLDESCFKVVCKIDHPHLPGLRSLYSISPNQVLITNAPADAVQIVDHERGKLEKTLRMPEELYGLSYQPTRLEPTPQP